MTDLPSREVFTRAYDHLVTRTGGYIDIDDSDPEFAAYRQLMRLHVEGRLVDRETIDYAKAAMVIQQNNDLDRRIGSLTLHDFRIAVDAAIGDAE